MNKKVITKKDFMREVGNKSHLAMNRTKSVFDNIETTLNEHLKEADENTKVVVNLLDGVRVESKYLPQRTHNFLGEDIVVSERIKPKAVFTRTYVEKLNN